MDAEYQVTETPIVAQIYNMDNSLYGTGPFFFYFALNYSYSTTTTTTLTD